MDTVLTLAIVAVIAAQFFPAGRAFLSTGRGALTVVVVAAVAAVSMIPGVVYGGLVTKVVDLVFMVIWWKMAAPRLPQARGYAKSLLRLRG